MTGQPQDDMAGWLALHGLTAADVVAVLDLPPRLSSPPRLHAPPRLHPPSARVPLPMPAGLEAAWPLVCRPLARWLSAPAHRRLLSCRPVPPPPAARGRAFTLPEGPGGLPLVAAPWSGHPRDLLRLAHEAGHAAQALQGPPGLLPPPLLREACAFLAERALVDATGDPGLAALWQDATARMLGPLAASLRRALGVPAAPYDYGWNYPIARQLALHLPEAAAPPLFAGRAETAALLASLG